MAHEKSDRHLNRYTSGPIYAPCPTPNFEQKICSFRTITSFYIEYLNHIWYDERYWSKILFSTIPTPGHDLGQGHRLRNFMIQFDIKVFKIT